MHTGDLMSVKYSGGACSNQGLAGAGTVTLNHEQLSVLYIMYTVHSFRGLEISLRPGRFYPVDFCKMLCHNREVVFTILEPLC